MKRGLLALLGVCLAAGCGGGVQPPAPAPDPDLVSRQRVEAALDEALRRTAVVTDSLDALLRPVPLLTPGQEAAFRRFSNAQQLERARALGVRPASAAGLEEHRRAGRLLALEDTTPHWVVRRLEHSEPFVTPDARALLAEIGERFHGRLAGLGLPPFRLEVTSVMRTAASQEALRRVNPNAALGESTHEYGTTLDVAYASFAAPADPGLDFGLGDVSWLQPRVAGIAAAMLETVAARNSRELQAILGAVMAEVQSEGLAMVTLERLQPVYHFTVARRLAGGD
ncbi:MAG TPA: DUF5715 family protein [Longimicrobiales bacterium]|nr:DUF5715 family protein [Longimicrobiales bacterium]